MSINVSAIEYDKRRIKIDEFATFEDYETALGELMNCSTSWEPTARLLGNVQASTITGICQRAYFDAKRLQELEDENNLPDISDDDRKLANWYRQVRKVVRTVNHRDMIDKSIEDVIHDMSAINITLILANKGLSVEEAILVGLWSEGGGKG